MSSSPTYIRVMKKKFEERLQKNPHYTLRAYAANLNIDSGTCSQLLSGKRVPSMNLAVRLMDRLGLDALEKESFLRSLGKKKLDQGLKRVNPKLRTSACDGVDHRDHSRKDVSIDAFQAISRWYYYAILELVKLPDFQESPKWIARTLGISEAEARIAYERLFELQMLERVKGKVVKTHESFYAADPHLTTIAHRKRQAEVLEKSKFALESEPIELRNHSSMTVAIDPSLIPEAKKRIAEFLQQLTHFLGSKKPQEVYEIQLSLFSLQHNPNQKKEVI